MKDFCKAHEWVCENCHFKELPYLGLREFQEITVTSPTIDSVEYENIHILNFKSQKTPKYWTFKHTIHGLVV